MRSQQDVNIGLRQIKHPKAARSLVTCKDCGKTLLKINAAEESGSGGRNRETKYMCMECVRAAW
jgi:uncharacterized protein with PIN domain